MFQFRSRDTITAFILFLMPDLCLVQACFLLGPVCLYHGPPLERSFPMRELGQRPSNGPPGLGDPDTDDTVSQPPPQFRVKRWRRRRDPPQPPSVMLPCPKASVTSPRHQLNRWEEGMVSPNYRPPGGTTLSVGGFGPTIYDSSGCCFR